MKTPIAISILGTLMLGGSGLLSGQQVSGSNRPSEPLKKFLRIHLDLSGKAAPDKTTRITAVTVKIDHGKAIEDIVYVSGQEWCGSGGCTMLILKQADSSFEVLGRVTIVQLPIKLLPSVNNGYPDIGVYVKGGGILSGYEAVLSFNGNRYRYPSNPTISPARKATAGLGKIIIATTQDSVPLYD